jgi:hypothetical protein
MGGSGGASSKQDGGTPTGGSGGKSGGAGSGSGGIGQAGATVQPVSDARPPPHAEAGRDAGARIDAGSCMNPDASVAARWPDSATTFCAATCKAGDPAFGQDGSYQVRVPTYSTTTDTVTDSVTQLTWQRNVAATTMTWANASGYCDSLSIGGASDWRLPTWLELASVVDYGATPAMPAALMVPTDKSFQLWSASGNAPMARVLSTYDGSFSSSARTESFGTVCVRGTPLANRFESEGGCSSVQDLETGLVWQRDPVGIPSFAATWVSALAYCEGLTLDGHGDWRLPSIKELATLVVDRPSGPTIDPVFPALPGDLFLSSTPSRAQREDTTTGAFSLDFLHGTSDTSVDATIPASGPVKRADWPATGPGRYLRCVR